MEQEVVQNEKLHLGVVIHFHLEFMEITALQGNHFLSKTRAMEVSNSVFTASNNANGFGQIRFSAVRWTQNADVHSVADKPQFR